ncbi:MAG: hypothetical protein ACTS41_01120 [Candidatus Hodgkinia cicadicola]
MPFIFEPNHNVSPEQTSNLTFVALDWWLIHFPAVVSRLLNQPRPFTLRTFV